jgi:hypothetical protein
MNYRRQNYEGVNGCLNTPIALRSGERDQVSIEQEVWTQSCDSTYVSDHEGIYGSGGMFHEF